MKIYQKLTLHILVLLFILFFSKLQAQILKCGSMEFEQFILSGNPDLQLIKDGNNNNLRNFIQSSNFNTQRSNGSIIRIPVVVHLIGNNVIAACSSKVQEQIDILNQDFGKMVGSNGYGNGVDTKIQFCLAVNNPYGSSTNGIVSITGVFPSVWNKDAPDANNNSDATLKSQSQWPPEQYLNLYVVDAITNAGNKTILGYGTFPWTLGTLPFRDGVVIGKNYFGLTTGASNLGRTATHEIGHWLGLLHTFQGGCTNTDCTQDGDYCCDTPPVSQANFNCPVGINSCTTDSPDLPDLLKNYMDYTDDACMNMFTQNQSDRMFAVLNSTRYFELFSSCISHCNNHIQDVGETGIDCGGADCHPCSHCTNKIQDADEYGIDCGGIDCPPCIINTICAGNYTTVPGQCILSGTSYKCESSAYSIWTASSASSGCPITATNKAPTGRSACTEINILPEFSFTAGTYVWKGVTYNNSFQLQICGGPSHREFSIEPEDILTHNELSKTNYVDYSLSNSPNPFDNTTNIHYFIHEPIPVKIEIFDILGKKIVTLIDVMNHPSGEFDLPFDGSNLNPGIYICVFKTEVYKEMKRMAIIR